ncbi:hypothetical protein JZ751_009200 [Albula glossodonta]|uniref:Uncharacterized protein n=1 Tax=Albula glossodonta TaxID=121402 RepID=A0A8T2NC32_9TELE|nr:hypothetical protein JZ751_009200 [Albula glossodonta]
MDEYKEYKRIKAKLRLLEVLISKQDSSKPNAAQDRSSARSLTHEDPSDHLSQTLRLFHTNSDSTSKNAGLSTLRLTQTRLWSERKRALSSLPCENPQSGLRLPCTDPRLSQRAGQ